jgi:hypothetical protein
MSLATNTKEVTIPILHKVLALPEKHNARIVLDAEL